jgi:hypothetical protein
MRAVDLLALQPLNAKFLRAVDFGPDIERWEKGDSHPHDDHLPQRVEAGPFVVAHNVCSESFTKLLNLLVEMMVLFDREDRFAFKVLTVDSLLLCKSMVRGQNQFERFSE